MANSNFLPFALPCIGEDEIQEVVNTMRSGWLTSGQKTKEFEEDFCNYIGVEHSLTVNSATAGLHLALESIGVSYGDKVITSPYTFTATAEVIRYLGADPVFVDIEPDTFNISVPKIEEKLNTEKLKAIMPVHFAGQACDMSALMELASKNNLKIVEDAAHALPATYLGQLVGTFGDLTVYSFYATKTIATGEGGMVVTNNSDFADRIRTMRLHGINRDVFDRYTSNKPSWYYEVVAPGYKYNMTDIAASIGIHQLKKANHFQKRRQAIADKYTKSFYKLPLLTPCNVRPDDIHAWHLYVIQLELDNLEITRDRFIELMADKGIGTSVHFIPLHMQPYWRDRYGFSAEDFPVAYDVYRRAVSLPIYPSMTDEEVSRVVDTVSTILEKYSK